MQPGDLVRINSLWHVLDRGPGLPADLLPGTIGTLIEPDMSGLLSWGWKILVGDQLFSHVNECYMETIDATR